MQNQILSVQNFIFQGHKFQIYGSNDNPLFLVNDIVCGLLEITNISNNQFFRDNRDKPQYITTREFPACPSDLQERYKSNKPSHIYFFTEKGLYKCLMRSNKPIAGQFQDEICDLLKNIRLGVIGLQILQEEEFKKQLEDKQKRIGDLEKFIEESKEDFFIYEHRIIQTDEVYRGITRDLEMRNKSHRNKSCNPFLREAIEQGKEIETRVIKRFRSLSRDEQKIIERNAILEIPSEKRLNIQIPRVKDSDEESKTSSRRSVSRKHRTRPVKKQEDRINDDLSIIMEEKQKRIQDDVWMMRYSEIMEFVKKNKCLPSNKIESDRDQVLKAKWIYRYKKNFQFLDKKYQVLLYKIPGFSEDIKELDIKPFELRLKDLQEAYMKHTKITENTVSGTLRCFYGRLLKNFNNNTLTPEHRQLAIDSGLPLTIPKTPTQIWEERYQQVVKYKEDHKKLPVFKKGNENDLGRWIQKQISECADRLTEEQRQNLELLGIKGKRITSTKEYEQLFKNFYITNQRMPKFDIKEENKLYRWTNRQKQLVQNILAEITKEEQKE